MCNAFKSLAVQLQGSTRDTQLLCGHIDVLRFISFSLCVRCRNADEMQRRPTGHEGGQIKNPTVFTRKPHLLCGGGPALPCSSSGCPTSCPSNVSGCDCVQTVCVVLWVAGYCTKVLQPLKSSLQKKKKKKKDASIAQVCTFWLITCWISKRTLRRVCIRVQQWGALKWPPLPSPQPMVVCGFQELTASLQDVLAQALEHIKEQEVGIAALKLADLSLEGSTEVSHFGCCWWRRQWKKTFMGWGGHDWCSMLRPLDMTQPNKRVYSVELCAHVANLQL